MSDLLTSLFPENPSAPGARRTLFVLSKRGSPFLFLPDERICAIRSLTLYPAQRPIARWGRELLRWGFRAHLTPFLKKTSIAISPKNPLIEFLVSFGRGKGIPQFGILAGNPNAKGRRFILLLFNVEKRPETIVKVGCEAEAVRLVEKEEHFLKSAGHLEGVPQLQSSFHGTWMRGFSLDFIEGNSPVANESSGLGKILRGWINHSHIVAPEKIPAWTRLKENCAAHPVFHAVEKKLRSDTFHSVIHHGDFAPWNIKVSKDGSWTAIDWERGELVGFPGWDWFHYRLQTWILVRRLNTDKLAEKAEQLLNSDSFLDYAQQAAAAKSLRELLLAYLLYHSEVIHPAEGLQTIRNLLNVLSKKWQLV